MAKSRAVAFAANHAARAVGTGFCWRDCSLMFAGYPITQ
ncbi:hypothetical protein ECP030529314_3214 [Escherichia coli p0305293.14]|nr:hypothetical protein ECP030529314_3214 [Escherichia coli p0305293.14]